MDPLILLVMVGQLQLGEVVIDRGCIVSGASILALPQGDCPRLEDLPPLGIRVLINLHTMTLRVIEGSDKLPAIRRRAKEKLWSATRAPGTPRHPTPPRATLGSPTGSSSGHLAWTPGRWSYGSAATAELAVLGGLLEAQGGRQGTEWTNPRFSYRHSGVTLGDTYAPSTTTSRQVAGHGVNLTYAPSRQPIVKTLTGTVPQDHVAELWVNGAFADVQRGGPYRFEVPVYRATEVEVRVVDPLGNEEVTKHSYGHPGLAPGQTTLRAGLVDEGPLLRLDDRRSKGSAWSALGEVGITEWLAARAGRGTDGLPTGGLELALGDWSASLDAAPGVRYARVRWEDVAWLEVRRERRQSVTAVLGPTILAGHVLRLQRDGDVESVQHTYRISWGPWSLGLDNAVRWPQRYASARPTLEWASGGTRASLTPTITNRGGYQSIKASLSQQVDAHGITSVALTADYGHGRGRLVPSVGIDVGGVRGRLGLVLDSDDGLVGVTASFQTNVATSSRGLHRHSRKRAMVAIRVVAHLDTGPQPIAGVVIEKLGAVSDANGWLYGWLGDRQQIVLDPALDIIIEDPRFVLTTTNPVVLTGATGEISTVYLGAKFQNIPALAATN